MLSQSLAITLSSLSLSLSLSFFCPHTLSLQLSMECPLHKSALAVECRTLHIFHNSHKTNHFWSITPFSHDIEYNTNSQSRHTGENRSGIALATNISLSASLSIVQNRSKTTFCLINHLTIFSQYFHSIFTVFSQYSAWIFSVICVAKSRELRNVITISSQLMIFSRYFHDSRYFQDIFTVIESCLLHHFRRHWGGRGNCAVCVMVVACFYFYCSRRRGEERTFFSRLGCPVFGPPKTTKKIITFLWSNSSGSSSFILFLNVIFWFRIMKWRFTRYLLQIILQIITYSENSQKRQSSWNYNNVV